MSSDKSPAQQSRAIVARLKRTPLYRDYEQAFRAATGLPLDLRPAGAAELPHRGDPNENPFCALMAQTGRACAACLQFQRQVRARAQLESATLECFAGLCDSAVPVQVGESPVAFVQTGQVLLHPPTRSEFLTTAHRLTQWGSVVDLRRLETAYFRSRVLDRGQYESALRLLAVFAQHLSVLSDRLMVKDATATSPAVTRARALIAERYAEDVTLRQVAAAVNMSACYFCKKFKQATGLTFTECLARVRVEKAKNLLLNPRKRVREAAYEAGFRSLSQFNRVFRRIAGESPSVYRERLDGP